MGTAINSEVFTFEFGALPKDEPRFYVARFEGTEALNSLFEFKISVLSQEANVDTDSLIGTKAKFTIHRLKGEDAVFCGYVSDIEHQGRINGYCYYLVSLSPSFGKLKFIVNSAVYLDKALKDTISDILEKDKFFSVEHEFRFSSEYPKKEFALQFEENSFDYILRRLEEQGAYFYFGDTGERVIFSDNPILHDSSKGTVYYSPVNGLEINRQGELVNTFELKQKMLPSRVVVRTYDWKNPNEPLVGIVDVSKNGFGDVYLTKEEADSREEAGRIARIRAEQIIAESRIFTGSGSVPFFRPGVVFTLAMHGTKKFNRDYIITKIKHEGRQETLLNFVCKIPIDCDDTELFYKNAFECIESDTKYRSSRTVKREPVFGVIHAFIDGDTAGRPLLDKNGRYKVLLPFDISGRADGKASCWVRRAQEQVGKDCGLAFPLSAGTEVLISFVDGDPNQPIIIGALANAETGSISGSGNSDSSGIRTDGGAQLAFNNKKNLIQLSNLAGSELMFGSGSQDYMRTRTHIGLQGTAVGGAAFSGALYDNICGFTSRAYAECDNMLLYAMRGGALLAKLSQTIFDSLSGENADSNVAPTDWGGTLTKIIPLLRSVLDFAPYNAVLSAEAKNSYSTLQCFPNKKELVVNFIALLGLRLTSLTTDVADIIAGKHYEEYPKKNAIGHKVWAQVTSCLPELAIIILTMYWRMKMEGKRIGGILIDAKDKNLNLHAKSYIGFHAERGIYLNTKNTKADLLATWGSPGRYNWGDNDLVRIFSPRLAEQEVKIVPDQNPGTLATILREAHTNVKADDKEMGSAVGDIQAAAEKYNFIAADTHLYLKKNEYHLQYQEDTWFSYASSYDFQLCEGRASQFMGARLKINNGNIQLGTDAHTVTFSSKVLPPRGGGQPENEENNINNINNHDNAREEEWTELTFKEDTSKLGYYKKKKDQEEPFKNSEVVLTKKRENSSILVDYYDSSIENQVYETYLCLNRDKEAQQFSITLYASHNESKSYLMLSKYQFVLKAPEVTVGGVVFENGKIKAAAGKCLCLVGGKIKIMLSKDKPAKKTRYEDLTKVNEIALKKNGEKELYEMNAIGEGPQKISRVDNKPLHDASPNL